MKAVFYIVIILLFANCKNSVNNSSLSAKKTYAITEIKSDTIIKTSKPFKINNIKSYWTHYSINASQARMVLKNYKTDHILIDTDLILSYWLTENYNDDDYFDKVNRECLLDINFDGFKDFQCANNGSNGAMSNSTLVYIFNPKTKSFDYSEDVSLGVITRIDSINKKLILSSEFRRGADSIIYYFDRSKSGKIIASEVFSKYSSFGETAAWFYEEYTKSINGEVVETKRDSTKME